MPLVGERQGEVELMFILVSCDFVDNRQRLRLAKVLSN
jgi:hypothetical protein